GGHHRRPGRGDNGRAVAVPLEEPQHAVRRLAASGRPVDGRRGRRDHEGRRQMKPAWLVLRDGRTFRGRALGAIGEASGEVIFNTAMQGYPELLTHPSSRECLLTTSS